MPAAARYTAIALLAAFCLWFLAAALGLTGPGTARRELQRLNAEKAQDRLILEQSGVSPEAIDEHADRVAPAIASSLRAAVVVETLQLAGFLGALILLWFLVPRPADGVAGRGCSSGNKHEGTKAQRHEEETEKDPST